MEILTWQARTKRGLSLRQLEALTGISRTTLNNIENGMVSPTLQELESIGDEIYTCRFKSCGKCD